MEKYLIPNLVKSTELLSLLARNKTGKTATEIESEISLPKATAFRILRTLQHQGFVKKENGRYLAGSGLVEIGILALNQAEIRSLSIPALQDLTHKTGFTSHLAIPSANKSLLVEVCDSPNPVRVASRPGSLVDLHCSSTGKIFLAYTDENQIELPGKNGKLEKYTSKTILSKKVLMASMQDIRDKGYAIDDQELHDDIRCVAAPIWNINHEVVAAIGITAPVSQFEQSDIPSVGEQVKDVAQLLSQQLGSLRHHEAAA